MVDPGFSDVHAVIVTFHPKLAVLKKCIDQLRQQVGRIVVVDNCSANLTDIKCIAKSVPCIQLVPLKENKGLGHAHNVGIRVAKDSGATHVLLLDQDSIPHPDMVLNMLSVLKQLADGGCSIAAVGARYVGRHAGNESFFIQFGWTKFRRVFCSDHETRYVKADFLISSGTLIPIACLDRVGEMDEGLFIDHVDTDWFLRAAYAGYSSYGACDAVMEHGLGEQTVRIWLGRWRYLPQHKPFRYYYIFRNSILLYRRPHAPIKWVINDVLRLLVIIVFCMLVVNERMRVLRMIVRGVTDGAKGINGRTVMPEAALC